MKVYVMMRYWDNNEKYAEDFIHHEEPIKVFQSLESAVNYLNALTITDILGSECKGEDGWYLDESEEWDDKFGSKYRAFHARTPVDPQDETCYESANIIFRTSEVEMEVANY